MRRAIAAAVVLAACATGTAGFDEALENGASCSRLYEIRNSSDGDVERMNERLRTIGCYSSTSSRTD